MPSVLACPCAWFCARRTWLGALFGTTGMSALGGAWRFTGTTRMVAMAFSLATMTARVEQTSAFLFACSMIDSSDLPTLVDVAMRAAPSTNVATGE